MLKYQQVPPCNKWFQKLTIDSRKFRVDDGDRRVGWPRDPAVVDDHAAANDVVLGVDVVVILAALVSILENVNDEIS